MAREDEETPELPAEETATPTADVTLEEGADATLTSEARSPELTVPAAGETEIDAAAPGVAEETAPAEETGAQAGPEARPYQPTDDYHEGERIFHVVWGAVGVVTHRDPREQVFRMAIGRTEERGRCHLIRVAFDKEVPASGGPRQEVTLIADWRGRPFDVGVPHVRGLPEPEALLGTPRAEEEAPAGRRAPALPEIPEPEEELEIEEPEEESDVEEIEPVGI